MAFGEWWQGLFKDGYAPATQDPADRDGGFAAGKYAFSWNGNWAALNTLKQFRDAFDMRFAAYRAISASRVTHEHVAPPQFYHGENVSIDFMWSDTCGERWKNLFGLAKPHGKSVERGHPNGDKSGLDHKIDWDMPRVKGDVVVAMSFTANTRFEVLETLFTYGLPSGI